MQYAHRYIQYAVTALAGFNGTLPLQHYLKQFFAADKKYGSKDRRFISHLCYCYFRTGQALQQLPAEERIKISLYLCSDQLEGWNTLYSDAWQQAHTPQLQQRIQFVQQQGIAFEVPAVFPWLSQCSAETDMADFARSHLVQPDVFLRVRPGRQKQVLQKLQQQQVAFTQPQDNCIALPPGSKADQFLQMNTEVVVQDLSSQRVGNVLQQAANTRIKTVWDCCAASGGKSILVKDVLGDIQLTVSDVRASIIHNLKQRFAEAGIRNYQSFVADLTDKEGLKRGPVPAKGFDLIVCDAPCSGSGTWGRTPEQLAFFTAPEIDRYATLQRKIVTTAANALAPGGLLLYITCSVFAAENEQQSAYIQKQLQLKPLAATLLKGYYEKADTMYAALFTKA